MTEDRLPLGDLLAKAGAEPLRVCRGLQFPNRMEP